MNKVQSTNISDLVEDGHLKVDDPEAKHKLLEAILYCLLTPEPEYTELIWDQDVNDFFEHSDEHSDLIAELKVEKVSLGVMSTLKGEEFGVKIWLDDDSDEGSDY